MLLCRTPFHGILKLDGATVQGYKRDNWKMTHILREGNFSADAMAKKEAKMTQGNEAWWDGIPSFVTEIVR
ncbi:hypothetical protein AQUCO_00200941v1 [Aquilegia coerulea]|uniref:RNase H type-1 domain-containing protein n=1 Tax=Aquilegia coerulea TaxID=218851 RepID=A0A2G5F5H2_AQUCA|nr:hypothetical protein AQUCO_00200941v1 [Aquilegia coerulea]